MQPTTQQFGNLQGLYQYFNDELFGGELKDCILTMIPNRTVNGGHFWPNKWHKDQEPIHEISMNPHGFHIDDNEFFISILVHEMCHLWIFDNLEKPPRAGYHCKNWGKKMKEVGLCPSNTGDIGGKETGQQMSHYIVDFGPFQEAFDKMDKDLLLPFKRYETPKQTRKKSKVKYTCPICNTNVWGKPEIKIKCFELDCEEYMESE